jgi:TldD protein
LRNTDLTEYTKLFGTYTELRVQENRSMGITIVDGTVTGNNRSSESGVSARCWKNGSWGMASSPEMSPPAIRSIIEAASENAAFLNGKAARGLPDLPSISGSGEWDHSFSGIPLSQKQIIGFLRDMDSHMERNFTKLTSRTVVLRSLDMEKRIITSTGSSAWSLIPRTILYVLLTADSPSGPVQATHVMGGLGQPGAVLSNPEDFYPGLRETYTHLLRKVEGVHPAPGVADCILDADLAGILSHEAIGHTTEADIVRGGSVAGDHLNEMVASPLVTLVDYASTAGGITCPVPVYVDDEGTPARDVTIIENGVLRSYLHNRETALEFGVEPTGNARGYRFSDEPLIRMRNTAIVPGESSLEDMISSIDKGYYLMKSSNGQADSTSEFMFGVTLGYEINGGKLGRALKDMTISGVAFDVLKTVSAVSSDMKWECGGMCGKKQPIPVGMGGPAVRCRVNIGGK